MKSVKITKTKNKKLFKILEKMKKELKYNTKNFSLVALKNSPIWKILKNYKEKNEKKK